MEIFACTYANVQLLKEKCLCMEYQYQANVMSVQSISFILLFQKLKYEQSFIHFRIQFEKDVA